MGKPNQPELHPWVEPATASVLITNGLLGTVSFEVTADVQAFLAGAAANHGWIVKKDLEGQPGEVHVGSRESGEGPRLVLAVDGSSDAEAPIVEAVGLSRLDPPGEYVGGQGAHGVEVLAADLGSGIERVAVSHVGGAELVSQVIDCSAGCQQELTAELGFDVTSLAEGAHPLVGAARDGAGNDGESDAWTLWVDRSPPSAPTDVGVVGYAAASGTATTGWGDGAGDPMLADGSSGSGVRRYEVRVRRQGGDWTPPDLTDTPDYTLSGAALGEIVDVEVRAIDAVGNVGPAATETVTVFDAGEYVPWYGDPQEDPGSEVTLTPAQVQQAVDAVLADQTIAAVLAGQQADVDDVVAWSTEGTSGSVIGAQVILRLQDVATLESDWPLLDFSAGPGSYVERTVHYRVEDTSALLALVRFDSGSVVSFHPSDGEIDPDTISPASGSAATLSLAQANPAVASEEGTETVRQGINLRKIHGGLVPQASPDLFWNWDFRSNELPPSHPDAANEADWPVAVIFTQNASVDDAKALWPGRRLAHPMLARVRDDPPHPPGHVAPAGMVDDSDKGSYKGSVCGTKWHFRAYAPAPGEGGDDSMFNLEWGFYVLATAHQDIAECTGLLKYVPNLSWVSFLKLHGDTESTAAEIAHDAADVGWEVIENVLELDLKNRDLRGRVGNRWYVNDGLATSICIRRVGGRPCGVE